MAVVRFLKLDGIDGEKKDGMHDMEIEVLAWSWEATKGGATPMSTGGGGGKACSVPQNQDGESGAAMTTVCNITANRPTSKSMGL